jgi:hypothetical protein
MMIFSSSLVAGLRPNKVSSVMQTNAAGHHFTTELHVQANTQ